MIKIIIIISVALCLLIITNSCTLNNTGSTTTTTQQGAFLVAQASPDADPLTIVINGNTFDTGFAYKMYTPYVKANPGIYSFKIVPSGAPEFINTATINIEANKNYSLFYIDSVDIIKTAFINDVFKAPATDSVYIRFFNFCPNLTESVNLVDSTDKNFILSSGRVFNDQSFNPQFTAFTELPAKVYILNLKTVSGVLLKTQTVTLTGGKVYTLIAKGINKGSDSLGIGILENYPQRTITYTF